MQSAQMAGMHRSVHFALGFAAAASLLLRAISGCSSTSNNPGGSPDAGEDVVGTGSGNDSSVTSTSDAGDDGFIPLGCNGGCLCFGVDACPGGCFVSQTVQPDGSASAPFCSNGIVACAPSGGAWSFGDMSNSCPVPDYPPVYLDGGPDGAFCCAVETDAGDAAVIDTGAADAASDAGAE